MRKYSSGDLVTFTMSLETLHLGHAVDLMRKSYSIAKYAKTGSEAGLVNRCAISSVLHSFCALESVINHFGYEMFFYRDSPRYVPVEKREFLLNKFLKNWDTAKALEKLEFILSYSSAVLPSKLYNQLRELNNIRNWIAHGFVYKTTILVDPIDDPTTGVQEYRGVDSEDNVDWREKYPNTKFKPLLQLDFLDSQLALTIILEVIKILSDVYNQPFSLYTCEFPPQYKILFKEDFNIQEIVKLEYKNE